MTPIRRKRGISSTVSIAAIVVLIIIAAAGWGAYAAFPLTKSGATQTVTTTVSGGSGGQTQTLTNTVTQTVSGQQSTGSATASVSTYLPQTTSTVSFTLAVVGSVIQNANWLYAQQYGIFKQYVPGLSVQQLAGAKIPQALISNAVQMAYDATSAMLPAQIDGAPFVAVANIQPEALEWGILVAGNATCQSLSCLHGKTFAVTTLGSTSTFETEYGLQQAMGWKPNVDYQISPLGTIASASAALQKGAVQGQAQAMATALPNMLKGIVKSVYNFSNNYPETTLYASNSFIQQHPDAVRATINAFMAAAASWDENYTSATNLMVHNFNVTPQQADILYNQWYYSLDGAMSVSAYQRAITWLHEFAAINSTIPAINTMSTEFVPITA